METFKEHLIQLYGEQIVLASRRLQRDFIKQAKLFNHLTFLKRCRNSQTIPIGLRLKSPIQSSRAERIIKEASMALTRERISHTREQLHVVTQDIDSLQILLQGKLSQEDFKKIGAFNDEIYKKTFNRSRAKQLRKFSTLHPTREQPADTSAPAKRKTVINLSNRSLSEDEQKVLQLGLNFAVAPKKIPFAEVIQQIEPNLRVLNKTTADSVRFQVSQVLSTAKPPRANISKEERAAIQGLRRGPSIHILKADKGNATVIMRQDEYDSKMESLLNTSTYTKLSRDPTAATERRINEKLLKLHREDIIPKPLYFKLRCSSSTCPVIFGQPKIHKPDTPLRPIVATRGSPTYDTARHLATILQPLVGNSSHHIANSKHFIEKLNAIQICPTDTLVSFDVESLFTNVPVSEACSIIRQRLEEDDALPERTAMSPEHIQDLLLTCLNSTSFQWRNSFYKQVEGAAMGSPLSPIVANIYMEEFETAALQTSTLCPKLWVRYVDDIFVVWQHSRTDLQEFLYHLNHRHPSIKFTMEIEQDLSIPFLDVRITRTAEGKASHQVYRKPTHTDRYLNFKSFHHPSVLQSVSSTLIRRAHDISDEEHLQQELQHIKTALTSINGYPPRKVKTSLPRPRTPAPPHLASVFLPYIGQASHKIQRILKNVNIQVRHRSSGKLHSKLFTHKDRKPPDTQPGVYKIPCECGQFYVGETGRSLRTRLKEHQTSFRRNEWEKSAIVKHAQQQNHRIDWSNAELITSIKHWHTRRVREAIEILQHDTVPQESGLVINDIWMPLLHHAHRQHHHAQRTRDDDLPESSGN